MTFSAVESVVMVAAMTGGAALALMAAVEVASFYKKATSGQELWMERASRAREMRGELSR